MDLSMQQDAHFKPGCPGPEPYPEIAVECRNFCYAQLLMEDYAGAASEFTAIAQYFYHHVMTQECKEVADTLEMISIDEMKHLELLAEAIIKLGGNPVLQDRLGGEDWTSAVVQYGSCMIERLHLDLAAEYGAIEQYKEHIAQIGDPCIKALLRRIVKDEERHVQILKELICRYGA